jgi:phosphatidylinositol alpha-mannosyltransferase
VVPYDLAEEGGVKRHAFHLADAMRRAGDEVEIVGPLSRGDPPPRVRGFGGVVNIPANGSDNHMALLVAPWSVGRFLRERRFDIVHLHEPMVPMLGYYALWLSRGSARVATFHMYAETESGASRTARRVLARLLFPALDAGIAVSSAAADFVAPLWRRPLHIIPNGVPTGVFSPADPAAAASARGPLRLLFVGNWRDRRKGLPVLLEAFRLARARGVDLVLDVIGEGQPNSEQRSTPGVTYLGAIASESVLADHYRRCDLFVAPATGQESFGIVLLEAMACGRPVVCSDIRGYRDVVDPDGAQLVPPGDAAALADAIVALATAGERRRAMATRNRLRAETFDWARLALKVRAVYAQALESQATRLRPPPGVPSKDRDRSSIEEKSS